MNLNNQTLRVSDIISNYSTTSYLYFSNYLNPHAQWICYYIFDCKFRLDVYYPKDYEEMLDILSIINYSKPLDIEHILNKTITDILTFMKTKFTNG